MGKMYEYSGFVFEAMEFNSELAFEDMVYLNELKRFVGRDELVISFESGKARLKLSQFGDTFYINDGNFVFKMNNCVFIPYPKKLFLSKMEEGKIKEIK